MIKINRDLQRHEISALEPVQKLGLGYQQKGRQQQGSPPVLDRQESDFAQLLRQKPVQEGEQQDKPRDWSMGSAEEQQQRLSRCFHTLLTASGYQDDDIQVQFPKYGRLVWRLINGPLSGCTLYAQWDSCAIQLEFVVVDRQIYQQLSQWQPRLIERINQRNPAFTLTLKVSYDAYF